MSTGGGVASRSTPVVEEQDDYVYYPGYEVYYSNRRHQYMYRDGNTWVSRPAPANVQIDVLLASPSVRMDFHDTPAQHHENVVRNYPKTWKPQGDGQQVKTEPKKTEPQDDRKADKKDEHVDDQKEHN
jgi:hypothetical protein